jgi:hypothetical protein
MKNVLKILLVLVAIVPLAFIATGCGNDNKPPVAPGSVVMVDGVLSWSPVDGAENYDVFAGSTLLGNTRTTAYIVPEQHQNLNLYVEAIRGNKRSGISSAAIRVNTQTDPARILEDIILTGQNMTVEVPSNFNRAKIIGEPHVVYNGLEIKILGRTQPLILEFVNVTATGRAGTAGGTGQQGTNGKPVITYGADGLGTIPQLTIISSGGLNKLTGGDGGTGGTGRDRQRGSNGGNGAPALIANNLVVMGDASIEFTGGAGGNGGRGGNLGTSLSGTSGGHGGNGGVGVNCRNIIVSMDNALSEATFAGGNGGVGGIRWQGSTGAASGGSAGSAGVKGEDYIGLLDFQSRT